ncbi:efflux RND transporter periplasmic adaptor subunit [Mastigocladopsis repens]|uniref:efflux RND transporter periplasmic adaptor subunit n=1 Tax=Mastigocladopsis repens TaxID=221287 RepID=UPI00030D06D0|nr:efflux RND transporter periplasmic adaptor subunit [Mastigocladopsis repens]
MQYSQFLSRTALISLVVAPPSVMGVLAITVLLPALKDPESRFYSSDIGYPAMQRSLGKPIKVQTVPVAEKSLEDSVAAPGESVAMQQVDVRFLVSGPVEKVNVVEGQWVRRGQPLLELQKAAFQDQVNTARNNLATAQKKLQTLQNSAPANLLALKQNVWSAKARLEAAKIRLKQIDNLAKQELKNNVEAAQVRLKTAKHKLQQMKQLAKEGAVSKFQLYDVEDNYASRKRELLAAQHGILDTQTEQFSNQDFYMTRQNELSSAQQALQLAQKTFDKDLADARLTVENRKIELQQALRNLNRTVIYANTDGLVSRVNIHSGEIVDVRDRASLLTLTQNTVFKAYIDQARLNAVKVGDKATVRLVAYPGRTFQGRVMQLNPTVETNATKRDKVGIDQQYTYSVWIAVDDLQMPPGLQGYVEFQKSKKSIVVPENSVTHLSAGEGMVMVAQAGKAVVKKVKLGRTFDNQREVLAGLNLGEQVVLSSSALNPGDELDIEPAPVPIAEGL